MLTVESQLHRHRGGNPTDESRQILLKSPHKAPRHLIRQIQNIRLNEVPWNRSIHGMECQLEAPHVDHTMICRRLLTPEAGFDAQSDGIEEVVQVAGGESGGNDGHKVFEIFGFQLETAECGMDS